HFCWRSSARAARRWPRRRPAARHRWACRAAGAGRAEDREAVTARSTDRLPRQRLPAAAMAAIVRRPAGSSAPDRGIDDRGIADRNTGAADIAGPDSAGRDIEARPVAGPGPVGGRWARSTAAAAELRTTLRTD